MFRQDTARPALDLYDDLMAITRIEATITLGDRRKAPKVQDYSRLARHLPGIKL
ncbi:hypothetical protein [Pararhodobacter zhoushanensis]|uniref:Uncharacterized protein n=1 Tax=Pararhodobacter zhoushanensis TaxID=2479545 RepID=A0ABT3H0H4_9RHOB|nr:hypothetical protein [Pararhodobacter zhoushanensis]MCW1933320.1 hypothetical protein [Pararhodobacter zhoushanensis]